MKSTIALFTACILLSGCVSTQTKDVFIEKKITSPKIIVMSGSRAPWVYEIQKRLRKNGFKIKRMISQGVVTEQKSPTKTETYNESAARFILSIDGYAPNTSMERCFGGGYRFEYIDVELIDVRTNETLLHYSDSGFSENCPPLSGTIFSDITESVTQLWQ